MRSFFRKMRQVGLLRGLWLCKLLCWCVSDV